MGFQAGKDAVEQAAQAVPAVLKLSDGAELVREGPHWSLRRDGNHIRYLSRFEAEFIRAAMQAAPQAQAAGQRQPLTEWQPIETAPKDGTLLLLWEQYESEPFIGSWYAFRSEWEASRTYYDTDGNACVVDRVYSPDVTHWMPLPAAPGATTGEQHG